MACACSVPNNVHLAPKKFSNAMTSLVKEERELISPDDDESKNGIESRAHSGSALPPRIRQSSSEQQPKRASYVPFYVQPLVEGRVIEVEPKSQQLEAKEVVSNGPKSILKRPRPRTGGAARSDRSLSVGGISLNHTERTSLLDRKASNVNVKGVIAAMEARITKTQPKPAVPPKIRSVANKEPQRLAPSTGGISRKAKHRRSMSDPHLHKNFVEVKRLWDNKVVTETKTRASNSRTSSQSSTGSGKGSPPENCEKSATGNSGPTAPPRSKTNVKRVHAQVTKNGPTPKVSSAGGEKPTMTANTSVSEKAMLFGGSGKTTVFQTRQPRSSSPAFQRHRRSWSDDSMDQASLSSKQSTDATHIYDEVATETKRSTQADEDELIVRSNADRAREKRLNKKRGSCDSSTDDEESRRRGSFLNNAIRRSSSKDKPQITPQGSFSSKQSPLVVKTTEATIFGMESPDDEKLIDDTLPIDHAISEKGRRRTSSLHKLIELKRVTAITAASAPTTPIHTPRPATPASVDDLKDDDDDDDDDTPRPTTLKLLKRERSRTEGDFDYKQKSSPTSERSNTMDNSRVKPPAPRTKPKTAPPKVPPKHPYNAAKSRPHSDAPSESSTDSLGTYSGVTSLSGEFNPLEEYNKIEQEINDVDTAPVPPPKPQKQLTVDSTDSAVSSIRDSLEVPSRPGSLLHGSNADSWSDFDNSDEGDEDSLAGTPSKMLVDSSATASPSASLKEPNEVKLHRIAKELLSTEESYVAVLHLIDQVFHKRVMDAAVQKHIMPEAVVNNIFCHIPAIYQFHSSFLLPQLRERLQQWETNPKIGDIMTRAAPFLKMYSLYVQHFDEAMNTIKNWQEKSRDFDAIIKSIQKLPECNFLTLQHHMLGPVQRIPRYKMLLEDYVKRLPQDAEERPVAETALQLISVAATHSNETMKKIDKFHKLVNVFNRLADVNFDIVDVSRELIKEGKIIKISARNGEKYERYLYLFSDMLLCCSPLTRLQGKSYKITAKIDLDGMQVADAKNPTAQNTFCVHGLQKSMEFATSTPDEKDVWVDAIKGAVKEFVERKSTFMKHPTARSPLESTGNEELLLSPQNGQVEASPIHHPSGTEQLLTEDADLGLRAPRWIKDHEVTMCMCCQKPFNRLVRRRHHCRACGRVVCGECSEHKLVLQYEPDKGQKVCITCFNKLTGRQQSDAVDGEKRGVLEVEADTVSTNSVIANYLFYSETMKKKSWVKTWCVIPNGELCLYFYGAHQDVRAQMTMPLPGYEVTVTQNNEHKHCFKLSQARKVMYCACDDRMVLDQWMYALKKASKGEDLTREEVKSLGKVQASNNENGSQKSSGASSDESWE